MELIDSNTVTLASGTGSNTFANATLAAAGAFALQAYLPAMAPGDYVTITAAVNFGGTGAIEVWRGSYDDSTVPRGVTTDPVPFNISEEVTYTAAWSLGSESDLIFRLFLL